MSLRTMLGKYGKHLGFNTINISLRTKLALRNCSQIKDWEFTRHRKKPQGGGRLLTNPQDLYTFNAWCVFVDF